MNELPAEFKKRIESDPFWDNLLLDSFKTEPPISIRLNSRKQKPNFVFSNPVPWSDYGYYLDKRPVFTLDPLFHAGTYYPQEAGSMFIEFLLNHLPISGSSKVLDLCAAPGGKSSLISSFLNEDGFLVSNEVIQSRNAILRENLAKWGSSNCIVTGNLPRDFKRVPSFFDVILVDAPCSGEGMFRKDPNSRNEWSEKNVEMCADRQREIVSDVWESLKQDGYLIYSTCTLNQQENENNVNWIIKEFDAINVSFPIVENAKEGRNGIGCYFAPGYTQSEGFFCAVLQKKNSSKSLGKIKSRTKQISLVTLQKFEQYVNYENLVAIEFKTGISVFPKQILEPVETIDSQLNCTKIGVGLGQIFPKKIEPSHELAMSNLLKTDIKSLSLSFEEALKYLKGETFSLDSVSNGYQLVSYQNEPLGWINHLGNRFNNLYPKEWRIRMNIN